MPAHLLLRCDYQSERHCSKTPIAAQATPQGAITSQNGTAPKLSTLGDLPGVVRLPVRTALLQNLVAFSPEGYVVRLPVRTALLQNRSAGSQTNLKCDYQSERHCSKTGVSARGRLCRAITSQNGTAPKRLSCLTSRARCAITSQNGTAPKPRSLHDSCVMRAITSQNGTAPKQAVLDSLEGYCAITSQNGTAPKQIQKLRQVPKRAITSQNGTAPKQKDSRQVTKSRAITSQNGTAPKPLEQIPSLLRDGHSDRRQF